MVASPRPVEIVEINTIKALLNNGVVVIAARRRDTRDIPGEPSEGNECRIDKDFASCILAKSIDADCLMILTAVEKVAINFESRVKGGYPALA